MSTFNKVGKMVAIRMFPSVYNSLNLEISDINSSGSEKFQDKNVNKEAVINAILIAYLSKPKDARRKILRPSMRALEQMLETSDLPKETDQARLALPPLAKLPEKDED